MKRMHLMLLALAVVIAPALRAQDTSPEITAAELTTHIKYLASDALEGRGSGSKGNQQAALYIEGLLQKYGINPAFPSGYLQPFEFVSSVKLGAGNALVLEGPAVAGGRKSASADIDAPNLFLRSPNHLL